MRLEEVVHRIATDPEFAKEARADLEAKLLAEGIVLKRSELRALKAALDSGAEEPIYPWYASLFTTKPA